MEEYTAALLLAGNKLNKRQIEVALSLCLYYSKYKRVRTDSQKQQLIRLNVADIADHVGLSAYKTGFVLESLCDFNIVGSAEYEENVTEKNLTKGLQDDFIRSLGAIPPSPNAKTNGTHVKFVCKACERAHFFISDGSKAYIFNPNIPSWKYPKYQKIKRGLDNFKNNFIFPMVNAIKKNAYKKGKNGNLITQEDEDTNYLIRQFVGRYEGYYGTRYSLNMITEARKIKDLRKAFQKNGYKKVEDIPEFFDWAFQKKKGQAVTIGWLLSLSNDYFITQKNKVTKDYVTDEDGNQIARGAKRGSTNHYI